jgi:hypothetical protein
VPEYFRAMFLKRVTHKSIAFQSFYKKEDRFTTEAKNI